MYFFFVFLSSIILLSCNMLHANRFAPNYWPEQARLEKEWLASFDLQHGHISAYHGYSSTGQEASLQELIPLATESKKLSGYDLYIKGYQNFVKGFFITGSGTYQSLTASTPLSKLSLKKWSDLALQIGWTQSYKETTELDFVDYTFKVGFYKNDPSIMKNEFGLIFQKTPAGILDGQLSIGLFEWLTIGFNCQAILTSQEKLRIITPETIINGNTVTLETFIQADHFVKGFSFGFGYSFSHEFEKDIARNSAQLSNKSSSHSLHLMLEYDFAKERSIIGPRIGFTFNGTVGGKNCLKSSLLQGTTGIEIAFSH